MPKTHDLRFYVMEFELTGAHNQWIICFGNFTFLISNTYFC